VIPAPVHVEQHEGEGRLRPRERPECDAPDSTIPFVFGDEAPLRAHRAGGEHALQILLDFFAVVRETGSLDEEVEVF
jgi:hypothetical protein